MSAKKNKNRYQWLRCQSIILILRVWPLSNNQNWACYNLPKLIDNLKTFMKQEECYKISKTIEKYSMIVHNKWRKITMKEKLKCKWLKTFMLSSSKRRKSWLRRMIQQELNQNFLNMSLTFKLWRKKFKSQRKGLKWWGENMRKKMIDQRRRS